MPQALNQAISNLSLRNAALAAKEIGGQPAVNAFLRKTVLTLVAVAICEQGKPGACRLMLRGLNAAEHYPKSKNPPRRPVKRAGRKTRG